MDTRINHQTSGIDGKIVSVIKSLRGGLILKNQILILHILIV